MSAPLQDAQWLRVGDPDDCGGNVLLVLASPAGAQGIRFACPCGSGHMQLVWFANPIGGGPPFIARGWRRSGETLETLTLEPSIATGCWHGYVRGGRTETVG